MLETAPCPDPAATTPWRVLAHVPVRLLAVREMPTSGAPAELLRRPGIDRNAIERAALDLIGAEAAS